MREDIWERREDRRKGGGESGWYVKYMKKCYLNRYFF